MTIKIPLAVMRKCSEAADLYMSENFDGIFGHGEELAATVITAAIESGWVVENGDIIQRIKDKSWCDVNYDDRVITLSELFPIIERLTKQGG